MLLALAIPLLVTHNPPTAIVRDGYGVPHIQAASEDEAWFLSGYAVAQDRLWQMEMSRRVARGRLSEVLGPKYVESDTEALRLAYTRAELEQQYKELRLDARKALERYADGVNAWIEEASEQGKLPGGYAANNFTPTKWEITDSVAISISLNQRFGSGASGQLRNLAALQYLKNRPNATPSAQRPTPYLDVFDDLGWWNDSDAPTTVLPEDDTRKGAKFFTQATREQSEKQLAALPDLTLLELLPALRAIDKPTETLVAETLGAPFKVGSYAMVVSPKRSATGKALLLSGPQMGFSNPSVVHEMAIHAPGLEVTGIDIPGVPGIAIGCTKNFAWGLTSGVADTDDVLVFEKSGTDKYKFGSDKLSFTREKFDIPIKGEPAKAVEQLRTIRGPVVLSSKKHLFSRRSAYAMREMKMMEAVLDLYKAGNPDQIESAIHKAPMSFNFFYATRHGETGYVYAGDVPNRAPGLDPRIPTLATKENDWRGMVPKEAMPHVRNAKGGLLTNWNNKPAEWWPNQDTPVWGAIDHVQEIRRALDKSNLSSEDLRETTHIIATRDETWPFFRAYAAANFPNFDGLKTSPEWPLYRAWLAALRHLLFEPKLGTMMSEDLFSTALQPTLMLRALEGKTRTDFLDGRKPADLASEAAKRAAAVKLTIRPDEIAVPGAAGIPLRNRGTFIQIVELTTPPKVQTILPPGNTESGEHMIDQADLARQFKLKPMPWR